MPDPFRLTENPAARDRIRLPRSGSSGCLRLANRWSWP